MAKRGRSKSGAATTWSGADHAARDASLQQARNRKRARQERSAADNTANHEPASHAVSTSFKDQKRVLLSHDTLQQRDKMRLKLHRTRTMRVVQELKCRLEAWDPVGEAERAKKEEAAAAAAAEAALEAPKKGSNRRHGPEQWKLKGAARPAEEIYDFDVRYVDPHLKSHEEARAKQARTINLLQVYRGKLGLLLQSQEHSEASKSGDSVKNAVEINDSRLLTLREYLSSLVQLGHLHWESGYHRDARDAFLECVELEGVEDKTKEQPFALDWAITTARDDLMRLYIDSLRQPAEALKWADRLPHDSSVWIRYSAVAVSLTQSFGSTKDSTDGTGRPTSFQQSSCDVHLVRAIRANPFCAYYLAFYATFAKVMEYTEDIQHADEAPQSSLEEAIEYCSSSHAKRLWCLDSAAQVNSKTKQTPCRILRETIQRAIEGTHHTLTQGALNWELPLQRIERQHLAKVGSNDDGDNSVSPSAHKSRNDVEQDSDDSSTDMPGNEVDVLMYAGMFRTAMEMVRESGLV
jgi:hypothetical protein